MLSLCLNVSVKRAEMQGIESTETTGRDELTAYLSIVGFLLIFRCSSKTP